MQDIAFELSLLILAISLDLIFAEPPLFLHPVVWFGKILEVFKKFFSKVEKKANWIQFLYGFLASITVLFFAFILVIAPIPQPFKFIWHLYLLFSAISIKSMIQHAENCLHSNFSPEEVQKIVSRDTTKLNDPQLRSAVIESTAENYVDGVFSPLFYFSIFGIAGAVVYRAINLCDSMIGYRGRYEFFGKFSARLDDLANFIPARLALIFFEFFRRGAFSYGIKNKVKLNGCTISAMSYVLGVKLEKPGYYSLPGRNATDEDVLVAIKIFKKLSLMAILFACLISTIRIFLLTQIPLGL
ncbi:MAG: adenosylcobinamide-phosphate synthase CbiB [Archaeoglobaceae archaeon]|nr:adenosylcobinamide-phosphate synthase CbiB [Archaeoglobaceae archaeon]MDW8118104.1 adenosylcobinamide-phosphate synthase CbiB [Archaeoglobaceae archaeon]